MAEKVSKQTTYGFLPKLVLQNVLTFCDYESLKTCLTLNKKVSEVVINWSKEDEFWRNITLSKFENVLKLRGPEEELEEDFLIDPLQYVSFSGIPCHHLCTKEGDSEKLVPPEDERVVAKYIKSQIKDWKLTYELMKFDLHINESLDGVEFSAFSSGGGPARGFLLKITDSQDSSSTSIDFDKVKSLLKLREDVPLEPFECTLWEEMEETMAEDDVPIEESMKEFDQLGLWNLQHWFKQNNMSAKGFQAGNDEMAVVVPFIEAGMYKGYLVGFVSTIVWG
mmetsp:Transcript_62206/g.71312  ORF Transcript_62206/g.71312 Transcript_62206/m.71312 type:complete len:280 (+) Transcript_62206:164-1003(+)